MSAGGTMVTNACRATPTPNDRPMPSTVQLRLVAPTRSVTATATANPTTCERW